MPSPFPGMDPYLEDHRLWEVFHSRFIAGMMDALNAKLSSKYVATCEQRLYIEEQQRFIRPDVSLIGVPFRADDGAVAVAEKVATGTETDERWEVDFEQLESSERFIEILVAGDESRVIAVIELLSPANKTLGTTGRAEYLAKQAEVLASDTHLVEIDLLQRGEPTVAVAPAALLRHGGCDYLACVTPGRSVLRRVQSVWPIRLRKPLPVIQIPLSPQEQPVMLDLQAVFNEVYDKAAFAKRINYGEAPQIRLTRADAEWVASVAQRQHD